jgi:hypothetical protein
MSFYSDQNMAFKEMERILRTKKIKRTNLFYYIENQYPVSELALKNKLAQLIRMGFVSEDSDEVLTWTGRKEIDEKRTDYEQE